MRATTQHILLASLDSEKPTSVRLHAIKELGKQKDTTYAKYFKKIIANDTNSQVRREAVFSLGRLRQSKNLSFLCNVTNDEDPKVVTQALLYFKDQNQVQKTLHHLLTRDNKMIRETLLKALKTKAQETIDLRLNSPDELLKTPLGMETR